MPMHSITQSEDIALVIQNARKIDREEVAAVTGYTLERQLPLSVEISRAYTLWSPMGYDPMAIYGVTTIQLPDETEATGVPWLIGTNEITKHPIAFLRATGVMVENVKRGHSKLYNIAWARNTETVRWLTWAGFRFLPSYRWGPFKQWVNPFYMTIRERTQQTCVTQPRLHSAL